MKKEYSQMMIHRARLPMQCRVLLSRAQNLACPEARKRARKQAWKGLQEHVRRQASDRIAENVRKQAALVLSDDEEQ